MTWQGSRLEPRRTADGSFSLFSEEFQEGFHSGLGALREAQEKYIAPSDLSRFAPGRELKVLDVCVGLGTNAGGLFEATVAAGLPLHWIGLELDPNPLALALGASLFRSAWNPPVLHRLEALRDRGHWADANGSGVLFWGDARHTVGLLSEELLGGIDLVLLDPFSPQQCPQLWTLEFLGALARLLAPEGRLLTYCTAAAVRSGLEQVGLQLASVVPPSDQAKGGPEAPWSWGTAASPKPLPTGGSLRALGGREREHLATRAAEPYRDPTGTADAATILRQRLEAQGRSSTPSSSAWRRRWQGGEGGARQ